MQFLLCSSVVYADLCVNVEKILNRGHVLCSICIICTEQTHRFKSDKSRSLVVIT